MKNCHLFLTVVEKLNVLRYFLSCKLINVTDINCYLFKIWAQTNHYYYVGQSKSKNQLDIETKCASKVITRDDIIKK